MPMRASSSRSFCGGASDIAGVERRRRNSETHFDDALEVLSKRRRELESPGGGSSGAATRSVVPLPGLRAGKRRLRRAAAGRSTGMAQQDQVQRDRWNARLGDVLVGAGAPSVRDNEGSEDLKTTVQALVGRARPGTVRLRVRSWEGFTRWLVMSKGRMWLASARDIIDCVKDMVGLPAPASFPAQFGGAISWIMSRSGFDDVDDIISDPMLRNALQWAEAELANDMLQVRKAPRFPVVILVALELKVVDGQAPLVLRVFAWVRLLKVYGGLRWDDIQRLAPRAVELRIVGLVGRLTRTKMSGVGRKVRELPLFIPLEAYVVARGWLEGGFRLFEEIGDKSRDFFVPRPAAAMESFTDKVMTSGEAAALGIALFED